MQDAQQEEDIKHQFNKNINNITNYFGKTMKSVWGGD